MSDEMRHEPEPHTGETERRDSLDRRGFLHCMAWAGTGLVWAATGGVLSSRTLGPSPRRGETAAGDFRFVQISDSHIGFRGEANKDVMGTLEAAIARIKALEPAPPLSSTRATSPTLRSRARSTS